MRIVLPLVLPALAQSLSPATEAADPPPKKGSSQRLPQLPPPYQRTGSHQGGPCKVRGLKERLTVALLRASFAQLSLFQRDLRLGALFVTACAHHEVGIFMSTKMSLLG